MKQTWIDVYLSHFKWFRKLKKGTWYKHEFTKDAEELSFPKGQTWWARYGKINRYSEVIKIETFVFILTLFLFSCNAKIITGKYAIVKEVRETSESYRVTCQLPNGNYLYSEQTLINFNVNDTVYLKWIRTEDMRVVRLFKL